jgi:hypothetical protein
MASGRRIDQLERHVDALDRQARELGERQVNEVEMMELVVCAELRAHCAIRRVFPGRRLPLVPPQLPVRLAELRALTGDHDAGWAARVERIGGRALHCLNPADPDAVREMLEAARRVL